MLKVKVRADSADDHTHLYWMLHNWPACTMRYAAPLKPVS